MALKSSNILETARRLSVLLDARTRRYSVVIVVLLIFSAGLEALGVGMVFPLVTAILDSGNIPERLVFLADYVRELGKHDAILYGAVAVFLVFVIKNALLLGILYIQSTYVMGNLRFAALELHRRYMSAPYAFFLRRHSSDMVQNIAQGANSAFVGSFMGFITLTTELLVALAIAATLFVVDPVVTATTAGVLLVGSTGFYQLFHRHYAYWGRRTLECSKAMLKALQESYGSIKEVKVLGNADFLAHRFNAPLAEFTSTLRNKLVMLQVPRLWLETVLLFGVAIVVVMLIETGASKERLIATVSVFAAAGFRILPSFNRLMMGVNRIKDTQHAVNVIYEDTMLLRERHGARTVDATIDLSDWENVSLEGVSFQYEAAPDSVIRDVGLDIRRGEVVGLVGRSGAGKTTLADLVLGLHDPTSGRITIDGAPLDDRLRAWQNELGYVPQDVNLIDDTIRANVAFGQKTDEVDEARVRHAIELAQLGDLVQSLPNGLDTTLGERGARISGGQKQRIGIARALYHDPSLIVFDEATSALDHETEQAIRATLESLRGERTLIIIAHRLNTVQSCDRIVFMADGRVEDAGTFDELVERNKKFNQLISSSEPAS